MTRPSPVLRQWLCAVVLSALPLLACETDTLAEEIEQLLRESRALVHTDGCTATQECAAAPVGYKPCGGPREYWVYCRKTTDEQALLRNLDRLRRMEESQAKLTGGISDCMFAVPPAYRAESGTCRAD